MVFPQGVGVSTSLAVRIYKTYGDGRSPSCGMGRTGWPARWGIGFKTADTIARAVGIPHDSPQRVQAGLQYTLSEAADRGHCYVPEPNLVTDAAQILGVPADLVRSCLAELAAAEGVIHEPVPNPTSEGGTIPAVYLVPFHRAETSRPPPCSACPPPRRTGWPRSARWTGARRWRGCGPGPGRSWPPSRSRRCAWR